MFPSAAPLVRRALVDAVLDEHPFATLVTAPLFASHLPFLRDGATLLTHVARANPHWRVEGKLKLSQNRDPADAERVRERITPEVAAWMARVARAGGSRVP